MNQRKKFARQIALIIFLSGCILSKSGAQSSAGYGIKFQAIRGSVYPHDKQIKKIIDQPVSGAELSVEFQTLGEKPWQQFNNFPIVGLGAVWLSLGNPTLLGDAFALYPYMNFRLLETKFFKLRVKAGMGASYLTKTYYKTNTDNYQTLTGNTAIGSHLNIYFAGGANMEVPITSGVSITADYTWNHMSNGSVVTPNTGLNLLNTFVGIKYIPNYRNAANPQKQEYPNINRNISWECIASGGVRQLYYKDKMNFPIGSLSVAAYKPLTNFYQMGLGLDGFYDGVFDGHDSKYTRTYLHTDELKNKFRAGISWRHELLLGKITAGFHFGLYIYDPIKNLEPYSEANIKPLNKPLIYTYDIDKEDGWLYTRAVFKYAVTDHLLFSVGLKTHLQKAEFIEWGVGYKL